MVELDFRIEQKPKLVGARKLKEFFREAFRQAVLFWHRKYLPHHFQSFSGAKYGYKKRRKGYQERKKARVYKNVKKGGTADLVLGGQTETTMTRPRPVRAYPTRAIMRMPGPSYVTMRPRDARKPNMGREITTVIASEDRAIVAHFESVVMGLINAFRETKTTRIAG